jgi:hypothetical protein
MTKRYSGAALAVALGLSAGLVTVAGAIPLQAQQTARPAAAFDPAAFFTGRTSSEGTLSQLFASDKVTRVSTFGTRQRDGEMILEQDVTIGSDPTRHRIWRLRETAPGRYTGTISDAATDVSGVLDDNTLVLTYTMDNHLGVHQTITVNPDGQSASNVMRIKRFGITVARLRETIRRH